MVPGADKATGEEKILINIIVVIGMPFSMKITTYLGYTYTHILIFK